MLTNNAIQDTYLNTLRKGKIPVTIFLVNGVQLKGVVTVFDNFVIVIQSIDKKQQMIFKHAVSTIVPSKSVELVAIRQDI